MIRFLKRQEYRRYYPDVAFILFLLGFSLYLMRPLFDWNTRALASDLSGAWALFYWLKESLLTFHQFPTWSPLWMGGMPFFGMIPPTSYFLILPVYLVTGDIPAAYNIATIIMFSLAGVSMYLYLKHLSQNPLASFLGAVIYMILPVHLASMMFWGLIDILCAYAIVPLVLLFTDDFLDSKGRANIVLLGLMVSLVLLLQIEYALIFLLFYVCYLILALGIRRIGLRSMSALIRRNKVGVIVCLLILLVPLSFYITVLTQYGHFSGLTQNDLERGLNFWTFRHFSDPFQDRLAGGLEGYFNTPQTDYYSGPLSFIVLLAAMASAVVEKGNRRAQLVFFTVIGMASLVLSMGVFGPFFPALRKLVPFLSGMRAPLRFYYIFALCLPVLFALSFVSFSKTLARVGRIPTGTQLLLANIIPVLLIAALILDLSPYFDLYHHRVLDKKAYDEVSTFLKERIREDNLPADNIARVLFVPALGVQPDRVGKLEQSNQGQFTIETAESWVPWNQYEAAVDYNHTVYHRILGDRLSLAFYADLLSYDYIIIYKEKIPPLSLDTSYLNRMDRLLETLNSLCGDEAHTLVYRGSLGTQYYTVNLYRINKDASGKARFYALGDSLLLTDDDLYASQSLFNLYRSIKSIGAQDFLSNIAAVYGEGEFLAKDSRTMGSVPVFFNHEGELLLLQFDPSAVHVLEAEDCDTNEWAVIDREGGWGLPNSGVHMVVSDVTLAEDNYLRHDFTVEIASVWVLNVSYLAWYNTGDIDIYLNGQPIATIDTYSRHLAMKTHSVCLFLDEGRHELRLAGRSSEPGTDEGSQGNWVEVDKIVLLNEEELPRLVAQSRHLWSEIASACIGNNVQSQSMEAEDFDAEGWVSIDREGCCGIPTSGFNMAVPDVTQAEDNYLRKSFLIGSEGNWRLDVSYFGHVDTGNMEIYVDDALVGTVDTFCSWMPNRTFSVNLYLNVGLHQVKVVGKRSDRDITIGSLGNWVEIDRMALWYQDEIPQKPPTQDAARISDFRLSPRGVSLDIEAADDGILSIAYYTNPWWRVYVDGKEVDLLRINGVFPGCYVGSGQHHVEFIYNYPSPVNLFSLLPR